MRIDHLMWGAPDLESGIEEIERLLEIRAIAGGAHTGLGTRNALVAFDDGAYLEIIAPDPDLAEPVSFGARLSGLEQGGLVTWAAGSDDLVVLGAQFKARGLGVRGPREMARITPQGLRLNWSLLFVHGHSFGNRLPFFIDWQGSAHPGTSSPICGALTSLSVRGADVVALAGLLESVDTRVRFEHAELSELVAVIDVPVQRAGAGGRKSPGRRIELTSTPDTLRLQL
ncbi:MAG: VOC family protein [Pseudomonadales bacterium]